MSLKRHRLDSGCQNSETNHSLPRQRSKTFPEPETTTPCGFFCILGHSVPILSLPTSKFPPNRQRSLRPATALHCFSHQHQRGVSGLAETTPRPSLHRTGPSSRILFARRLSLPPRQASNQPRLADVSLPAFAFRVTSGSPGYNRCNYHNLEPGAA